MRLRRLLIPTLFSGGISAAAYDASVSATSPLAYFPMDEASGTVMVDSINGNNGAYSGIARDGTSLLGQPVPLFDGVNDYADAHSAGLSSIFDMDEGCLLIWLKVSSASVWTDGTVRSLIRFRSTNLTNFIIVTKTATNNTVLFRRKDTTGEINFSDNSFSGANWMSIIFSWSVSNDEIRGFKDGVELTNSPDTGLNTANDSTLNSSQTVIGASSTSGTEPFDGYLARVPIWGKPVDDEILALATINGVNA